VPYFFAHLRTTPYSVSCCAYPAVLLFFCALTLLCGYPALRFPLTRTLLCPYFLFSLPAVPLFFYALTLLRPYFTFAYPAVPLFFFALTLLCPFYRFLLPTPRVVRVPSLTLARRPPEGATNNCGRPANLSGPCLGAAPAKISGGTAHVRCWQRMRYARVNRSTELMLLAFNISTYSRSNIIIEYNSRKRHSNLVLFVP